MYKSLCPGWIYGNNVDIKHIVVPENTEEKDVLKMAKKRANESYGINNCSVKLIQKYNMLIKPIKSYSTLTTLSFEENDMDRSLD
jgi:hypothetical protein